MPGFWRLVQRVAHLLVLVRGLEPLAY